jgi:dTDP-glucose 4,6-dehydratase
VDLEVQVNNMLLFDKKMKVLLITGGAGFIGSNLILHFLKKYPEYIILNVDCLTYASNLDNLEDTKSYNNYHFINCDIRDRDRLENIFKEFNPQGVIHLAAESHVDNSITNPNIFAETNVIGTLNLLNLSLKYKVERFHHVSTDEVFGSLDLDSPSSLEDSLYKPRSPYSASKASSDHFVNSFFHTFNLNTVMTNCSNNFGPHQHDEKLIPTIIRNLVRREEIPVYGDGKNIRDWLYVEDHCKAIDLVYHNGKAGESYNIGGDMELTNLELIDSISHFFDTLTNNTDSYKLKKFVTDRPGHDLRYSINHDKITRELEWHPNVDFKSHIINTINYYLKRYEI